jgi:plastocyanin
MKTTVPSVLFVVLIALSACAPRAATSSVPATSAPATAAPANAAPAAPGSELKVNISGFAFDPPTVTIKVGDTVTWTNQDAAVHTVAAADNSWTSADLAKGASYSHTFTSAGTFAYICGVHHSMKGTVVVQ